jgi:hypothetical protein
MQVVSASPADLCVDTDMVLTATNCAALVSFGVKGVFRYVSDVSILELNSILGSGLKLFFVNHSRSPGWIPSASEGTSDGQRDVKNLQGLGVPKGVHMFFDLEGVGGGSPQAVIAHVTAWAAVISAAGYIPAIYVGAQALLTSAQLYALPVFLYWCSASNVTDITGAAAMPGCNWSVYQGRPVNTTCAGVLVDFDSVYEDNKNRLPKGVAA